MADFTFRPEVEVLSAADGVRRRHWSDAEKLRIVEETLEDGAKPAPPRVVMGFRDPC